MSDPDILKDIPGPDDLPVITGPPVQAEPAGQTLGGPHPDEAPKQRLREAAHSVSKGLYSLLPTQGPYVTPQAVVSAAQGLLGTGESPSGSNCNAITHRCGVGCVAWCDETVWTAYFNAGFNRGGNIWVPGVHTDYWFGDAYVPNTMRHFQSASMFSANPVMGAGEIHFWGGGEQNSHIAIYVQDYGNGTHLNIEGNHNNVCEYVRRPNQDSTRMGYCIPPYQTAPQPVPPPPPPPPPVVYSTEDEEYPGIYQGR